MTESGLVDVAKKAAEDPNTLSVSDVAMICIMTMVFAALTILIIAWCRENNYGIKDISNFIFVKLPNGICIVLSCIFFVLFCIILYLISFGLVNIKIETEYLGKGDIPAWPRPLANGIKFIFKQFVRLIVMLIELSVVLCEEVYKHILRPIGFVIKSLSISFARWVKRKYNDWLIEPSITIAKAHMVNGGWE